MKKRYQYYLGTFGLVYRWYINPRQFQYFDYDAREWKDSDMSQPKHTHTKISRDQARKECSSAFRKA